MAVTLSSLAGAGAQFFDNNGVPLAGGLIYTYLAGTSTPAATYTSSTGSIAHANPIVLDAAGRIATGEVWLTSGVEYKFVVKTALFVQLGSYDNISSINDFTVIYAALANTTDVTLGDALIGFKQSNASGALSGAVGRTVHQKLQELVSVKDFGAVGDGTTDDTAAIQSALNACSVNGNLLYVPAGKYLVTGLTANHVSIVGTGSLDDSAQYGDTGSVFCQTNTTNPMITVSGSVTIQGMSFYYPNQTNAAITPTVYNATIYGSAVNTVTNLVITNSVFINSYDCINLTRVAEAHGRVMLSNVFAYAINRFAVLSGLLDVFTCVDCQITPGVFSGVATAGSVMRNYTQTNGICFDLSSDVDGLSLNSSLFFGYSKVVNSQSGEPDFLKIIGCLLDSVIVGVNIGGTSRLTNCIINSNNFYCNDSQSASTLTYGIKISGSANVGDLNISNNTFSFSRQDAINIVATSVDSVIIQANKFSYWGQASGLAADAYAVYLSEVDANFIVSNNTFLNDYANAVGVAVLGANTVVQGNEISTTKYCVEILGGSNYVVSNNISRLTISKCLKITSSPSKIVQSANYWDATSDLVCGVTDTFNYGTVAGPSVTTRTVTVPGVTGNDGITLGLSTTPAIGTGLFYSAYVSAVNTVSIVITNLTASAVVVGSQTINIYVAPRF
jgi:hypothetical protein